MYQINLESVELVYHLKHILEHDVGKCNKLMEFSDSGLSDFNYYRQRRDADYEIICALRDAVKGDKNG